MKDIRINILAGCLIGIVLFSACSVTKHLPEDEILYTGGKTVIVNKSSTRVGETALTEINAALAKTPSTTLLGGFLPIPFKMWMYNDFVKYKKGFGKWMFNRFAANPPVFISTVNPEVRVKVATNLLRDYGYFNGKVTYETLVDKKDSLKASLLYTVDMKNPYFIDTVYYQRFTPQTLKIMERGRRMSYITPGEQFNVVDLDEERSRISTLLRNRGYFYFRPDYMTYQADTTLVPGGHISLRLIPLPGLPAAAQRSYYVGDASVYLFGKNGEAPNDSILYKNLNIHYYDKLQVRPNMLYRWMNYQQFVRSKQMRASNRTRLYSQYRQEQVQEKLSQLGIFSYMDMQYAPRDTTAACDTLDVTMQATFAKPLDAELELNVVTKSNDQTGPGASFGVTRNNVFGGGESWNVKLKGSYGLVGNDNISDERFFYLSEVSMDGDNGMGFGTNFNAKNSNGKISIKRYANPKIGWEISHKLNVGFEMKLFKDLEIQAEYFKERRTNILQTRADIPTLMGFQVPPQANIGEAKGHGVDISLDYSHFFNKNLWATIRGNFTYASSKFSKYEEPDYSATPWRSKIGTKLSQEFGLIAERLFVDEEDVANSPKQQFGEYMAGDIKYKDINHDGIIDEQDRVPIGYPTTPEIIYGFGFSIGYKDFDFNCFFQGSSRSSFFISPADISPFIQPNDPNNELGGKQATNALLQIVADDHWSEANQNMYAFWPRLSDTAISNNNQKSTWWLRDGTFLRMKSAEIGYTLPKRISSKAKLENLRIYVSGTNLFNISKFKTWDTEMGGNGLGYPVQRVFNIGVQLSL